MGLRQGTFALSARLERRQAAPQGAQIQAAVPAEVELPTMSRPTPDALSKDEFERISDRIAAQGGWAHRGRHIGRHVSYPLAPQPGQSRTCGCGAERNFRLIYKDDQGRGKSYIACADCDLLPRQPRFM